MELMKSKNQISGHDKASQDKTRRHNHVYINTIIEKKDVLKADDAYDEYEEVNAENKTTVRHIQTNMKRYVCFGDKRNNVLVSLAVLAILFIANLGISVSVVLSKQNDGDSLNGAWSKWGSWGQCSATCSTGMENRNRTCSNPSPSNGGNFCFGDPSEYRLCNKATCSVTDGQWSQWTEWLYCSDNCMKSRTRSCTNPAPSQYGHQCVGNSEDKEVCNWIACIPTPVKGGWSSWTSWSSCSATTCMKSRTRTCTNPAPSDRGLMCQGNGEDKEPCNLFSCIFKRIYVRLVNGTNSSNGRVEVSLDGWSWGTVCDDNFDASDAKVVCRMLHVGYTNASVMESTIVDDGSGPIYLDGLGCIGNETSLLHCNHKGWGIHSCGHYEDVGVFCG